MDLLFWTYLINATILIIHEMDSAYWQEWKLIYPNDQNSINGFLILHIPMIIAILLGWYVLNEPLTITVFVASGLILIGVALVKRGNTLALRK